MRGLTGWSLRIRLPGFTILTGRANNDFAGDGETLGLNAVQQFQRAVSRGRFQTSRSALNIRIPIAKIIAACLMRFGAIDDEKSQITGECVSGLEKMYHDLKDLTHNIWTRLMWVR
jgi:hypothetical protein